MRAYFRGDSERDATPAAPPLQADGNGGFVWGNGEVLANVQPGHVAEEARDEEPMIEAEPVTPTEVLEAEEPKESLREYRVRQGLIVGAALTRLIQHGDDPQAEPGTPEPIEDPDAKLEVPAVIDRGDELEELPGAPASLTTTLDGDEPAPLAELPNDDEASFHERPTLVLTPDEAAEALEPDAEGSTASGEIEARDPETQAVLEPEAAATRVEVTVAALAEREAGPEATSPAMPIPDDAAAAVWRELNERSLESSHDDLPTQTDSEVETQVDEEEDDMGVLSTLQGKFDRELLGLDLDEEPELELPARMVGTPASNLGYYAKIVALTVGLAAAVLLVIGLVASGVGALGDALQSPTAGLGKASAE